MDLVWAVFAPEQCHKTFLWAIQQEPGLFFTNMYYIWPGFFFQGDYEFDYEKLNSVPVSFPCDGNNHNM